MHITLKKVDRGYVSIYSFKNKAEIFSLADRTTKFTLNVPGN